MCAPIHGGEQALKRHEFVVVPRVCDGEIRKLCMFRKGKNGYEVGRGKKADQSEISLR